MASADDVMCIGCRVNSESELVERFFDQLRAQGVPAWWDGFDGLNHAEVFVPVLSKAALASFASLTPHAEVAGFRQARAHLTRSTGRARVAGECCSRRGRGAGHARGGGRWQSLHRYTHAVSPAQRAVSGQHAPGNASCRRWGTAGGVESAAKNASGGR